MINSITLCNSIKKNVSKYYHRILYYNAVKYFKENNFSEQTF